MYNGNHVCIHSISNYTCVGLAFFVLRMPFNEKLNAIVCFCFVTLLVLSFDHSSMPSLRFVSFSFCSTYCIVSQCFSPESILFFFFFFLTVWIPCYSIHLSGKDICCSSRIAARVASSSNACSTLARVVCRTSEHGDYSTVLRTSIAAASSIVLYLPCSYLARA